MQDSTRCRQNGINNLSLYEITKKDYYPHVFLENIVRGGLISLCSGQYLEHAHLS